ncbi:MAG TPA: phosphatase PAP2 family protein [Flavitalea sp.]|nr:phosphatase PAP2 family protein [Flavitalea sp.]
MTLIPLSGISQSQAQPNAQDSSRIFHWRNFVIPTALVGIGIYGSFDNHIFNVKEIREERGNYFPNFAHTADNYLQFAPLPAVFAMDAMGFKSVHPWNQQVTLLAQAQVLMMAMVYPMKTLTKVPRPDNSSNNSFPSGHTAEAFLAAHFFQKEFGREYPWMSVGMYSIASGIAVSRVLNNRHWASDVFAGAGIGMASVELSYLLGAHHKQHQHSTILAPSYSNGIMSCSMVVVL